MNENFITGEDSNYKNHKKKQISKKYFFKIHVYIFAVMILMILTLSVAAYYSIERIVTSNDDQNNKEAVYQYQNNIDTKHINIVNLCQYLFFNPDVDNIMRAKSDSEDLVEIIRTFKNINSSLLSTNPFIHSVYIYNGSLNTYYSTYKYLFFKDVSFEETIRSYKAIPKLKPVERQILDKDSGEKDAVFSYFMYNDMDKQSRMNAAVIINVKAEYFLGSFEKDESTNKSDSESIWGVINDKKMIIPNKAIEEGLQSKVSVGLNSYENTDLAKKDVWKSMLQYNGSRYVAYFLYDDYTNLTLFKLQPYAQVARNISRLRLIAAIVAAILLLLAISLSYTISRKIYKPFGNLVKQVSISSADRQEEKNDDEFVYLTKAYKTSADKVGELEKEKTYFEEMTKEQTIKKLLFESYARKQSEFLMGSKNIVLSDSGYYIVCILMTDKTEGTDENGIRPALKDDDGSKFMEKISQAFPCDGVHIDNNHFAVIIQFREMIDIDLVKIKAWIHEYQTQMMENSMLSVTIAISNTVQGYKNIAAAYKNALNISKYRIVTGRGSIITSESIIGNISNPKSDYKYEFEEALTENVKRGDIQAAEKALDKLMLEISKFRYNDIIISLIKVAESIKKAAEESEYPQYRNLKPELTGIKEGIYDFETIREFKERVIGIFDKVSLDDKESPSSKKYTSIVNTILSIIENNYSDSELFAESIAAMVKLSPKYMNKIFKDMKNISISEYINDVRLKKAADLLENTNISVNDVIYKVGFTNRSYFYGIFKKKYGLTPKEYALKKSIEKIV